MIQLDSIGYRNNADSESNSVHEQDLKTAPCDDKENSIDNSRNSSSSSSSKQKRQNLTESAAFDMAECEAAREGEDVNGNNLEDVNGKSMAVAAAAARADDEHSAADDNEHEPGEISFNQASALEMHAHQAAAASAAMSEANALFNNAAMFQPGMSMQTFQNAIAQFTANAIANNMDNETVMKNLAILQSALFTLQQQQFLQFQLIQHLQSQLVNKKGDGSEVGSERHHGKPGESEDEEEHDVKMKEEEDIDEEEEGELDEIEQQRQQQHQQQMLERHNQIQKRLMESKHFSKMQETLMKESENRNSKSKSSSSSSAAAAAAAAAIGAHENGDSDPLSCLKKSTDDSINSFTSNFSLASNIITDHDPTAQINESTNSLAMLEKKAQEVLNSASQGILSNNLLDELAFANDKASPNGRTDSALFKHRCRYCGKIFGSDSSLQIHIRSHTGERPYKCNVCGSRFTTKGNLKVHFQRHSDKYPHIPMNPNPVPEHLDKYFPPLVPSEALKEMPNAPPQTTPPFSSVESRQFPQRGFFPDFYLPRPPLDIFSSVAAAAGGEISPSLSSSRNPVDLSQVKKPESPTPPPLPHHFRLSPEVVIHEEEEEEEEEVTPPKQLIKEEPAEDETLDLSEKSKMPARALSPPPMDHSIQTVRPPAITQPLRISSPNINHHHHHHRLEHHHHTHPHHHQVQQQQQQQQQQQTQEEEVKRSTRGRDREREKNEEKEFNTRAAKSSAIESLAKVPSVSPPSSSSSTSGSLYQDTVLDPNYFSAHLPRPDSNDSSWENFIEISNETSKLQELVDNLDNKNIEPNQCLVCKKVLSCRSALQMHYRVHTGERPFRCKICGRSFTTKGNLKTHMSVHRIKPPMRTLHQCPVCHQKFSNIFVLQQHIRLHTGEMTDLTPDQIRAAEIRDFPGEHGEMKMPPYALRMPEFQAQKRAAAASDDENDIEMAEDAPPQPPQPPPQPPQPPREKKSQRKNHHNHHNNHHNSSSSSNNNSSEGIRVKTGLTSPADIENHVEDLRAMNLQRLSVQSNDDYSRDSSPASPNLSEAKRLRSSSPQNSSRHTPPAGLVSRSPIATPPANERPPFPYGPPFLGMPQFPPFINRPPFMANVPMVPSTANMPPFGLFGVRGNTTTCNICFKTFACNSALEIHYRSHTKERPYKCSICDRGFSTKGNMKQHMLTHKIRDMFGNSNSGDESRLSSNGGHTSDSQSNHNNNNQQINFAIKLEKSRSPSNYDDKPDEDETGEEAKENGKEAEEEDEDFAFKPEPALKKWCNKLNEMPENIAAS